MTEAELHEIEERTAKATPGPWYVDDDVGVVASCSHDSDHPDDNSLCPECRWLFSKDTGTRADTHFVAHAREDIPALLAEIEQLRQVIDDLHEGRIPLMPDCPEPAPRAPLSDAERRLFTEDHTQDLLDAARRIGERMAKEFR